MVEKCSHFIFTYISLLAITSISALRQAADDVDVTDDGDVAGVRASQVNGSYADVVAGGTAAARTLRKETADNELSQAQVQSCKDADSFGYFMCPGDSMTCNGRRMFWSKQSYMTKVRGDFMTFAESEAAFMNGDPNAMEATMLKIAAELCPKFCLYLDWCDKHNNDKNARFAELNGAATWDRHQIETIKNGLGFAVQKANVFLWTSEVGDKSAFCTAEKLAALEIFGKKGPKGSKADFFESAEERKRQRWELKVYKEVEISTVIPSLPTMQAVPPFPWKEVAKYLKQVAFSDPLVKGSLALLKHRHDDYLAEEAKRKEAAEKREQKNREMMNAASTLNG